MGVARRSDTLRRTVPIALLAFDFDPLLRLADGIVVRWQTVALVAIVATGLVATGLIARRNGLRADDLLFIAVAVVPGAVIGGRLGYVLLHVEYYAAKIRIDNRKTVGADACAGCDQVMMVVLTQISVIAWGVAWRARRRRFR